MVRFDRAKFEKEATFHGAAFNREAHFPKAAFRKKANFGIATFNGEMHFPDVHFEEMACFDGAAFKEKVAFYSLKPCSNTTLDFRKATIEKPERVYFHNTTLHASWFVDVDSRKFDFTNVKWCGLMARPEGRLEDEIKFLQDRKIESPHKVLAQACRRLSANAEENREYPLANEFHYWSMDALRKESWHHRTTLRLVWGCISRRHSNRPRSRFGLIATLYWVLSGYGVRATRAFWALVTMWAAFTAFYVFVSPSEFDDKFGQGIGYLWHAAVYSLLALARLSPDPNPKEPGLFQLLVGLEGILGLLQIGLLLLAVRRQVMR